MNSTLNQPNHSAEQKRSDIRSFYQSLSPNKSAIIRINTEKNNLSVNGLKANCSTDSIVVYRLSSDQNTDLFRMADHSSSHSRQFAEPNCVKKRYLVSQRSGKVYEVMDKSPVHSVSIKREATEPDTDLICDDEYFKYLNLIGSKKLKTDSTATVNEWPLRNIAKVVPNPKLDNCQHIILTDVCPKPMTSKTDVNTTDVKTAKCDDNSQVSRRKLAKSQWLTEVKDSTNRLLPQRECNTVKDLMTRKLDKELKEWQTNALNTISEFGMSSAMGLRLFKSLFTPLTHLQMYLKTIETEKYCSNDFIQTMVSLSLAVSSVSRITRTRDGTDWSSRYYQHKYCFNRLQRLEKCKQLETGLNWRSRLMMSMCRPMSVQMDRLNVCPICMKTIRFEPRHQCHDYEPYLRPANSAFRSNGCDSSDEVVIIGNDFLSEDLTTIDYKCSQINVINRKDVITTTDSVVADDGGGDDDDIMIVEEVFKTKGSNVIIKSLMNSNSIPNNSLRMPSTVSSKRSSKRFHSSAISGSNS